MDSHYLYLLVNLGCISVPFAFSFDSRLNFYKKWKALVPALLITMAVFIPWDIWFTNQGIWGFNPKYLIGVNLFGLPIEEWLFFICIPYACVFTYEALRYYFKKEPIRRFTILLNFSLVAFCLILAFLVPDRRYPLLTALLMVMYLAIMVKWKNLRINGWFVLCYIIILLPFILSNGILTGITFWEYPIINLYPQAIDDQIVWYNNAQNLRIRIFSMPVDDLLYGLLMLFMNISIYDLLLKRNHRGALKA